MDNSRNFAVTEEAASGKPGDTITLNYTGATTGTNEYIPILVGYPSLGLWPSRTSVPLFSHVVVAMGLSSALCTCHGGSNMVMS